MVRDVNSLPQSIGDVLKGPQPWSGRLSLTPKYIQREGLAKNPATFQIPCG